METVKERKCICKREMKINYIDVFSKGSIYVYFNCECGSTFVKRIRRDYWYYRFIDWFKRTPKCTITTIYK